MNARLLARFAALALAVLGCTAAGCDSDDSGVVPPNGCSDAAAVTREELDNGAPALCEHQTLVASLHPKDDYMVPLSLVRDTVVEYCFEDDDGEAHRASIVRNGVTVLSFTAGQGCVPAHLSPGLYGLRLRHQFLDDRADPTPDVVHTRLEARGDGTHRITLATNACPGCDLRGKAWPYLGIYITEGPDAGGEGNLTFNFGWEGDYTGAHFDGSVCQGNASIKKGVSCSLGAVGYKTSSSGQGGIDKTKSSFDGATFDGTTLQNAQAIYIGRDACLRASCNPPSATTFKGASFRNLVTPLTNGGLGTFAFIGGDLTGVDWENTAFSAQRCAIHKAVLGGGRNQDVAPIITVTAGTYGGNRGASHGNVTGHLGTTCNGRATCTYTVDHRVIGDPVPNQTKDYVAEWTCPGDPAPRRTTLGAEADGKSVTLSCTSAVLPALGPSCEVRDSTVDLGVFSELQRRGTKTSGNTIHVPRGGDLSKLSLDGTKDTFVWPLDASGKLDLADAKLAGATVSHITFPCAGGGDGGDLSRARFDGATLDTVALSGCKLAGARFDGATLRNVTARSASFLGAQLVDVVIDTLDIEKSIVSDLQLQPRGAAMNLSAVGVVGKLLAPSLSAPGASFVGATLALADFTNARLGRTTDGKTVSFEGAILDGTVFTGADLDGASFVGAKGKTTRFDGALLRSGASLKEVQLFDATLDNANFSGASFTSARVCGGSAAGAVLTGADLTDTLFPDDSNIYTVGGDTFTCAAVRSRSEVATDAATTCPDATKYAVGCEQGDKWTPASAVPTCCKTGTPGCVRKVVGATCAAPCDCVSAVCVAGQCG